MWHIDLVFVSSSVYRFDQLHREIRISSDIERIVLDSHLGFWNDAWWLDHKSRSHTSISISCEWHSCGTCRIRSCLDMSWLQLQPNTWSVLRVVYLYVESVFCLFVYHRESSYVQHLSAPERPHPFRSQAATWQSSWSKVSRSLDSLSITLVASSTLATRFIDGRRSFGYVNPALVSILLFHVTGTCVWVRFIVNHLLIARTLRTTSCIIVVIVVVATQFGSFESNTFLLNSA